MFHECLFISPDLDGHRAPKMKYCPTEICGSLNPNLFCSESALHRLHQNSQKVPGIPTAARLLSLKERKKRLESEDEGKKHDLRRCAGAGHGVELAERR